ncbi:c-type cytochrome [Flavobacterium pedocola]
MFWNYSDESEQIVGETTSVGTFCGTKKSSEMTLRGKQLFNSSCAACHKLDAATTGPALRNKDSVLLHKWLYYQNVKIDTTKLEKLGIDYHLTLSRQNFKITDLKSIYTYLSE